MIIYDFCYCRQSSSSNSQQRSSHGLENADYVGVGIVGHSNDARLSVNQHDEENEDVQSIVGPSFTNSVGASRYSSSSAHEAEDMQQRVLPADLSSISSSAYRSSQVSEHDEDELQKTVGHGYKPVYGGSTRIYSQSRGETASETSRTGSIAPVPILSQTQSHRSSQSGSETASESRKPVPTGQYVSMSVRPGSSTVLAVPVRVIQTHGIPDEHQKYYTRTSDHSSGSESRSPTSTTYRVVYNPTRNFVSSDKISSISESERVIGGVQQPEKLTNYNSYAPETSSQSRFNVDEQSETNFENHQVRVAPVSVSYPSNGGSSRFASSGSSLSQNGQTQTRVVPVFPVTSIESASSSRTAEERDQRRYTPSTPTYISSSRNSELEENRNQAASSRPSYNSGRTSSGSDQQSSSQFGTSGSVYYIPSTSRAQTQAQQQASSGSQTQYQRQGGYNFSPYGPTRTQSTNSQSSDRLSQRFGTGILNTNTDDLQTYMSESERLARLQQQQISGSSSNSALSNSEANRRTIQTASNLDSTAANFVRTSNLANRNSEFDSSNIDASGTGSGFNRVRSWNKQSKWSSGKAYEHKIKPF